MIREITINNIKIQYELQYKKVKNINLRINPDSGIKVSANKMVSTGIIDEFIVSKADFIMRALDKYQKLHQKINVAYFTEDGIKEYILTLCKKEYLYFKKFGVGYPEIKFRKMVSRWGSCHSKKGILTFNINLMFAPPECIRYVVLHEFTHFLQPNHSFKFYNELAKVCPNWKKCKNKLKDINIR